MADIVQLKENGVVKYMKTHADAIDGVEGKLVKAVGNETVLGTKNFQDGVQIGGKVVTADRIWRTAMKIGARDFIVLLPKIAILVNSLKSVKLFY
ncbi:hypothetical protein [Enterococcus faecalis]|uniref:hypothetical protein n=1 Tax=Enterococcus faecalis TaxID=1351 RepID=UPI001143C7B5|nr:hypothetical protein [Enterococcus faecalis]TQB40201.1 hypothetical protein FKY90_03655 [Enterococcus faecalis]